MSKYWTGRRYSTGEKAFTYLRIWKHMPEKSKHGAIRRKMWLAKAIKIEESFKYIKYDTKLRFHRRNTQAYQKGK
jgi:hypothetical protein